MEALIHDFLKWHGLCRPGIHILAAVSGGADSTAMLHALAALARASGFKVSTAHLNHRIRGRSAERDAQFVRECASRLGVRCYCGSVDVPALARRRGLSIEMAARQARYDFLERIALRIGADAVATAHTADDQAETVLLKLARGAGSGGLGGIAPVAWRGGVTIVRPLLTATRDQVIRYLESRRLAWREDETNRDRQYLRNRVRHVVLPSLARQLNPRIRENLARAAELVRADNEVLDGMVRQWQARHCPPGGQLPRRALLRLPLGLRRRIVQAWLAERGMAPEKIEFAVVEQVLALATGSAGSATLSLPDGQIVCREYNRLRVFAKTAAGKSGFRVPLKVPGVTRVPAIGVKVVVEVKPGVDKPRPVGPGNYPALASLGRVERRGLVIRSWRPGDRIRPFGMRGSKKIHDILVDAKVPRADRGRIPVVAHGDTIVWLPGYRVASGWEVRDSRRPALQLRINACRKGLEWAFSPRSRKGQRRTAAYMAGSQP